MVDKIWYNMEELIGGSEERGINRNILECKAASERRRRFDYVVLIETYWNVKKFTSILFGDLDFVLIETYWNVKGRSASGLDQTPGINRNHIGM